MSTKDFVNIVGEVIIHFLIIMMIVGAMLFIGWGLFEFTNINKNEEIENVKEYQIDTLYINDSIIGYNIKYVK